MDRSLATATVLTILGLAGCAQNPAPQAQSSATPTVQPTLAAAVKCYGVAAAGQNDCKAGAHSCAGHSTADRDPASFISLPAGACTKLDGGSLTPA